MKSLENPRMKISADPVLVTTLREQCNVRSTRSWEVDPRHAHPSATHQPPVMGPSIGIFRRSSRLSCGTGPWLRHPVWRCQYHTRTEVDDDMRPGIYRMGIQYPISFQDQGRVLFLETRVPWIVRCRGPQKCIHSQLSIGFLAPSPVLNGMDRDGQIRNNKQRAMIRSHICFRKHPDKAQ